MLACFHASKLLTIDELLKVASSTCHTQCEQMLRPALALAMQRLPANCNPSLDSWFRMDSVAQRWVSNQVRVGAVHVMGCTNAS